MTKRFQSRILVLISIWRRSKVRLELQEKFFLQLKTICRGFYYLNQKNVYIQGGPNLQKGVHIHCDTSKFNYCKTKGGVQLDH